MSRNLIVLEEAEKELAGAAARYETQRVGLAHEFLTSIGEAMDRLMETPGIASPTPGVFSDTGARSVFVKRCPVPSCSWSTGKTYGWWLSRINVVVLDTGAIGRQAAGANERIHLSTPSVTALAGHGPHQPASPVAPAGYCSVIRTGP